MDRSTASARTDPAGAGAAVLAVGGLMTALGVLWLGAVLLMVLIFLRMLLGQETPAKPSDFWELVLLAIFAAAPGLMLMWGGLRILARRPAPGRDAPPA